MGGAVADLLVLFTTLQDDLKQLQQVQEQQREVARKRREIFRKLMDVDRRGELMERKQKLLEQGKKTADAIKKAGAPVMEQQREIQAKGDPALRNRSIEDLVKQLKEEDARAREKAALELRRRVLSQGNRALAEVQRAAGDLREDPEVKAQLEQLERLLKAVTEFRKDVPRLLGALLENLLKIEAVEAQLKANEQAVQELRKQDDDLRNEERKLTEQAGTLMRKIRAALEKEEK